MLSHIPNTVADVLESINLQVDTYICQASSQPWYVAAQYRPQGMLHIVTEGECYLQAPNTEALIPLKVGDMVVFPTGGAHRLSSSAEGELLNTEDLTESGLVDAGFLSKLGDVSVFSALETSWEITRAQESAEETGDHQSQRTTLLSCTFSYNTSIHHPLLRDLPSFIVVDEHHQQRWSSIRMLLSALESESKSALFGSSMIINRLAEILFIQLLRVHMDQSDRSVGYMAALSDPKIGVALSLIHSETDERWSVGSIATTVALSRTTFTERFKELVGVSPKAYLTNIRMSRAKTRLQSSADSMWIIAEGAGYSSEASFSKAFKKHFNLTPGQVRKTARGERV